MIRVPTPGVRRLSPAVSSTFKVGKLSIGKFSFSVIVINEVEKGSSAAEAGIQEEDVILTIDGHPAKEFTITQIRKMFMRDGKQY